ncbi:MAG TPA: glycoside hydrolase [Lentisphaeria bacterium]|nr:glycoside hydrolase [Lentisphaeria bacterium]
MALLASSFEARSESGLGDFGQLKPVVTPGKTGFAYKEIEGGIQLRVGGMYRNVIFYGERTVRVNSNPGVSYWKHPSLTVVAAPIAPDLKIADVGNKLKINSPKIIIEVNKDSGALSFFRQDGFPILSEKNDAPMEARLVDISNAPTYEVYQRFVLKKNESIYGLGQYTRRYMDYRGQEVYMAQSNIGICVPLLISTERYGLMWDIYSKSIFKDDIGGMSLYAESAPGGSDYYFLAGTTMDEVIAAYRELTGPAPMLSKSAFGLWMSKERYKTQNELLQVVRNFRNSGFPLDNIVQDWQYWGGDKDGTWSGMIWNKERFPDPAGMARSLHDELNVKLMCSIWPSVGNDTDLARELDQYGLRHEPLHWISKKARIYDAYSEKGREIYFKHIKKGLLDVGVDALWMDGTEVEVGNACPDERKTEMEIKRLGSNAMGDYARYLNTYSLVTTKGVYEGQRATADKRVFTLTRSGFIGQQRYAALPWSGDTRASFQTLGDQVAGGLNVSMAGQPYWTQDTGGFFVSFPNGERNPEYQELYVRWNQFGIFNPIYRIHGTSINREPYLFKELSPDVYKALLEAANLRYRLLPYVYSLAWQSTSRGYTMMRGMPMDFPDDPNLRRLDTQFMFGPALLVRVVDRPIVNAREAAPKDVVPGRYLLTPDGRPGVAVQYFNGCNFEKTASSTVEAEINQTWPGPPLADLPKGLEGVNNFSARYEGVLNIPEDGEYEIGTVADDGARLWLDNAQVVDDWRAHAMEYHGRKLFFKKGQKVSLKLEYYQGGRDRGLRLVWKTPDVLAKEAKGVVNDKVETRLPVGEWYDFWSGEKLAGGKTVERSCSLDVFPLYVRAGSILPMGPVIKHVNDKPDAPCEIRIYKGSDSSFTLYEDDGETYGYAKGRYATVELKWNDAARSFTVGKRNGGFPEMISTRTFKVVLVRSGMGTGVSPVENADAEIRYEGESITVKLGQEN